MYRWGHVKCFRFDNGRPFGDPTRETITPIALHLVARGCEVMFNPPRTPTKNAKVERCQGTTGKWSNAKKSANVEQFIRNLDYAVIAQRERFPTRVCKGQTRMNYYPALARNPRKFNSMDYNKQRVFAYLLKGQWYRKISTVGQTYLFKKNYQVGHKYKNQRIIVKLSIENQKLVWNCYDQKQNIIKQIYAENLNDGSYFQF